MDQSNKFIYENLSHQIRCTAFDVLRYAAWRISHRNLRFKIGILLEISFHFFEKGCKTLKINQTFIIYLPESNTITIFHQLAKSNGQLDFGRTENSFGCS